MKKITYTFFLFFFTWIFCLFMWFFWLKNTFAIETIYNNSFDFPDSTSQFIWYWNYSNNVMISNVPNSYWQTHPFLFYKSNSLAQFGTWNTWNVVWSHIGRFSRSSLVKYKDSLLLYWNSSCNNYWGQWYWYYTAWYDGWGIYNFTNSWFILKSDSVWSSNTLWYMCSWYWREDFRFFLNNGLIFSQNWWAWKRLNNNNTYNDYTWAVPEQLFPHFGQWKIWYSTNNFLFYSDSINELKYIKYFEYSAWVYTSTGTINLSNYWLSLSWNTIDIEKVEELSNEKFKIYFTHNNWLNSQSYIIDTTNNSKLTENQTIFFLWNQNFKINLSWVDYKIWLKNKPLVIPHNDWQNLFKIYKKNWDTKLYFDPSVTLPSIDEWWWNSEICTQNNNNCTCISTPSVFNLELKNDYSIYWNNPVNYSTWNTNFTYFRFKKLVSWYSTIDFTFWDFSDINFYNSSGSAIFEDNQKYISFLNWSFNVNNSFFRKNELNIKIYSWSINNIQIDSLDDYNFNLFWINTKWEKELIWNFQTNISHQLQNKYFNLSIEFDWYQYWWYSIKKIFLKDFDKVYWEEKISCVNKKTWKVYYDWQEVDYNTLDNLDPNIIKDIIDWKIESDFKQTILNDIQSVINSQSLSSLDVSWSWMIVPTIWTWLNPIVSWDFWTWSCRMFWDNLQFLYYSNWQMSFNFSFWDFNNMFLDWLSFLWDKIIWIFTAPLNNTVSFITILTPFWTNDKAYCLFWNVVTYQPHKMFIWTPYHNKMLLIDYLVLFAYWTFLLWTLALMHWIVSIWLWELPTVTTTSTNSSTSENKNIDWRIVRITSNKRTDVSTMRHKKTMRYK